jgi:hypothetical protein
MLLRARETIVRSAYAVLEARGHERVRRRPGVLYLTTERLVFEAPLSRGRVRDLVEGQEVEIVVEEPLVRLRNATVRQGRWSRARLVVDGGGPRTSYDVLEPEAWTLAIADAHRRATLAAERAAGGPGPAGGMAVKVRCRYCGGLGDEGSLRCPSCGAPF